MITILSKYKNGEASKLAKLMNVKLNQNNADIAIRWGYRKDFNAAKVINKPEAIVNASNKLKSFKIMEEHGVPTVTFVEDMIDSFDGFVYGHENYTSLYGRKIHHTKGKDIVLLNKNSTLDEFEKFLECDFYTVGEHILKEYRIHVFGDNVFCSIKYKVKGNGGLDPNPDNPDICRNWNAGWRFATIEGTNRLVKIAKQAVSCLGLDFGAVDILLNKDHIYKVLEVNTAPGLDNIRRNWYVENIKGLVNEI